MRMNIAKKMLSLVGGTVIIMMVFCICTVFTIIKIELDKSELTQLSNFSKVVDSKFNDMKSNYLSVLASQVIRQNIIDGVNKGDSTLLKQIGEDLIKTKNAEFVVFTDTTGKVIARGHTDKKGDNISYQYAFKKALDDVPIAGIENGTVVKLSLRTAAPIKKDGKIIGVMIIGMNIFQGNSFVDTIKQILDIECTIFENDTRLSTTIVKDGKRAIGTKMDNPLVLKTVIEDGQVFNSVNKILGNDYTTIYWPLKDIQEKTVGMLFLGKTKSDIDKSQKDIVKSIIMWISFLGAFIIGISFFLINKSFVIPIRKATIFASLATNEKTSRELNIKNKDEIGDLANALNEMVSNLKKTKSDAFREASDTVSEVEIEISKSSKALENSIKEASSGAKNQKSKIKDVQLALSQLDVASKDIAVLASETTDISEKAKYETEIGVQKIEDSISSTNDVMEKAEQMNESLIHLGGLSDKVGKVMSVISEIASQTHILAINAKIESARAGESGKGFAQGC